MDSISIPSSHVNSCFTARLEDKHTAWTCPDSCNGGKQIESSLFQSVSCGAVDWINLAWLRAGNKFLWNGSLTLGVYEIREVSWPPERPSFCQRPWCWLDLQLYLSLKPGVSKSAVLGGTGNNILLLCHPTLIGNLFSTLRDNIIVPFYRTFFLENKTNILSRNVGSQWPCDAASLSRRTATFTYTATIASELA